MTSPADIVREIADDLIRSDASETYNWADAVEAAAKVLSQKSLDEIRQLSEFEVVKIVRDIADSGDCVCEDISLCIAVGTIAMRVCEM